jgi:hypothetical protein
MVRPRHEGRYALGRQWHLADIAKHVADVRFCPFADMSALGCLAQPSGLQIGRHRGRLIDQADGHAAIWRAGRVFGN